jgi:hypothetical protein
MLTQLARLLRGKIASTASPSIGHDPSRRVQPPRYAWRSAGQSNQRSGGAAPRWEFVHVAIDDHSRLAFSQIPRDEKQASAIAFLKAAVNHYRRLGVEIACVMTDNGSCYIRRGHSARPATTPAQDQADAVRPR